MGNSKTQHSRKLRQESAKKATEKILDAGGIRFSVILEPPYAQQFEALALHHGSKKKALLYLLENDKKR